MFATLKDPIQVFLGVIALAFLFESILHERHKEKLRGFLARLQKQSIIPHRAIEIVDRAFGNRLWSARSIATSSAISILGALVTCLIINVGSADHLTHENDHIDALGDFFATVRAMPLPMAVFLIVYLAFDYLSFVVTRVFVRITADMASLSKGLLMFVSDFLVSTSLCILGLATASALMILVIPEDIWPSTTIAPRRHFDDILYDLQRRVSVEIDGSSGLRVPQEVARDFSEGGLTLLVRRSTTEEDQAYFTPEERLMLGVITPAQATHEVTNRSSPRFVVSQLVCVPPTNEISPEEQRQLARMLYGMAPPPACPFPVFFGSENPTTYRNIPVSRWDEILFANVAFYTNGILNLTNSRFREYVVLNIPHHLSLLLRSAHSSESRWPTVGYYPEGGYWYQLDTEYISERSPEQNLRLPISPLLASAIWLSLAFYAFVAYSLFGRFLQGILVISRSTLRAFAWTNAPVNFIGFVLAGLTATLMILIQLLVGVA